MSHIAWAAAILICLSAVVPASAQEAPPGFKGRPPHGELGPRLLRHKRLARLPRICPNGRVTHCDHRGPHGRCITTCR